SCAPTATRPRRSPHPSKHYLSMDFSGCARLPLGRNSIGRHTLCFSRGAPALRRKANEGLERGRRKTDQRRKPTRRGSREQCTCRLRLLTKGRYCWNWQDATMNVDEDRRALDAARQLVFDSCTALSECPGL